MVDFTADQIVQGIETALREREIDVIPGLIKLLAGKDPARAQAVYDTLQLGIRRSRAADDMDSTP